MARTADPAALLAHGDWLRQLARGLTGASAADDAVQDTWVAALRSPPDADRPARPWLARVLGNAVRMRHRGEGRRARHEHAAAALEPTAAAGPDAALGRAEAYRTLVDLVVALPEAERTLLVQHYFDGESLAAIARRTGVPEGTLRWRHKQALERLRARLDAGAEGHRGTWLAALAPLASPPAHGAPLLLGGLLVNKLLLGAAVAAIVGVVAWRLVDPSAEARAPVVVRASAGSPAEPPGAAGATAPADSPPRRVRRLAGAAERQQLLSLITAARERRASATGAGGRLTATAGADTGGGGAAAVGPDMPSTLDRETIRDAMHEALPFLGDCYVDARPTRTTDHLAIVAHLTLTGDPDIGTLVDASQLDDDDEGGPLATKLDDCLRAALQTLELPPLSTGASIEVNYPLLFGDGPSDGSGAGAP